MSDLITDGMLKDIIEATLFVSGEGIDINAFAEKLEVTQNDVNKAVKELKKKLSGDSGIHLIEYKNKIQLSSNPNYADQIASVLNPIREKALTKACMETLSIIAYKQPITRLEIEEVRGVNCDYTVQVLLEHNLIEVVGRKDVIGKPLLFGTTEEFLKRFDLKDLTDLPNQEEILERIKLIRNPEESSESLYYDYKLPDEEEVPDFLQGEEFQEFSSDESEADTSCEENPEMTEEEVVEALTETEQPANEEEIC